MAITLIHAPGGGGKLILTETPEESAALTELSLSLEMGTFDYSERSKRRARKAWWNFERLLGERLESTAGIKRHEVFGGKGK